MNCKRHRVARSIATALAASVLAVSGLAAPLTFEEALRMAEDNAPSLTAQTAKQEAARSTAIPADALPDPQLVLGVQNYPVDGPDRWSLDDDFMTMQMVGVMQEVPNQKKRRARREVANATIERVVAESRIEHLQVRQAVATAWISRYAVEHKQALFQGFYRENRLLTDTLRALIAGGRAQPADAISAKQEAVELAEQEDILAQQNAHARAALRRWIGAAADEPLTGGLPEWPISALGYGHRLQQHPALDAFGPMSREAAARVREAEAEKTSDWSWELDYQRRGREFGDMVSVQFTFDLPLLPGARQTPRIAARRAELNQLEAEREALSREHAQHLEEDLAEYQRLDQAVRRNQQSLLQLAQEKVDLTMASYRANQGELVAVVAARRELIKARLKQVDLEARRALIGTTLHFAYGENHP